MRCSIDQEAHIDSLYSSSGKTQLLLQTALYAALGLEADFYEQLDTITEGDAASIICRALRGYGMQAHGVQSSVAILSPDGSGAGLMMTRRLCEMCDYAIRERWSYMLAKRAEQPRQSLIRVNGETSRTQTIGAGHFYDPEDVEVVDDALIDLDRLLVLAKSQLLRNVHFLSVTNYDEMDHAVSYMLPALADRLAASNNAPLQLIVIDDLPAMLLGAEPTSHMQRAIHRSQMVCELSDKLRRFALHCARPASERQFSPAAIVLGNHVVDSFERTRELVIPILRSIWEKSQQPPTTTLSERDDDIASGKEAVADAPPLQVDQQDLFFSGVLSNAHPTLLGRARSRAVFRQMGGSSGDSGAAGKISEDEIWDSVASGLKMAALGYQWANCIHVRLMLHRTARRVDWKRVCEGSNGLDQDEEESEKEREGQEERKKRHHIRRAVLVKSPFAQSGALFEPSVDFVVLERGIRSVQRQVAKNTGGEEGEATEGDEAADWEEEEQDELDEEEERDTGQGGSGLEGDQLWHFVDGHHFDEDALATMDILPESASEVASRADSSSGLPSAALSETTSLDRLTSPSRVDQKQEYRSLWRHESFTGQALVWDKMRIDGEEQGMLEEEVGDEERSIM